MTRVGFEPHNASVSAAKDSSCLRPRATANHGVDDVLLRHYADVFRPVTSAHATYSYVLSVSLMRNASDPADTVSS
jgi:hypothetical protein